MCEDQNVVLVVTRGVARGAWCRVISLRSEILSIDEKIELCGDCNVFYIDCQSTVNVDCCTYNSIRMNEHSNRVSERLTT